MTLPEKIIDISLYTQKKIAKARKKYVDYNMWNILTLLCRNYDINIT